MTAKPSDTPEADNNASAKEGGTRMTSDDIFCLLNGHSPTDGDFGRCHRCGNAMPSRDAGFVVDDASRQQKADLVHMTVEAVIDAIEDRFLAHLPSKALSFCAQEDVNAGLDAMRELFGVDEDD